MSEPLIEKNPIILAFMQKQKPVPYSRMLLRADEFKEAQAYNKALIECAEIVQKAPTIAPEHPHWVSVEQPPKKEGKYFVAYRSSVVDGYGYDTAYYTKHLEDKQLMIPVPENSEGWFNWSDYNDCDVLVCPDYWMPIEPPKEDA